MILFALLFSPFVVLAIASAFVFACMVGAAVYLGGLRG